MGSTAWALLLTPASQGPGHSPPLLEDYDMPVSMELWSAFVTLLVTIGPIDTAAVFASLTSGVHKENRIGLAIRAVCIAGLMLLLFALAGNLFLSLLHVSLPAFQVAGGILLFLQSLTLTFSKSGL